MESAGLRWRISGAIRRMVEAPIIDEQVFDLCLKEIKLALFQTDVPFPLVRDLQINVKNRVDHNSSASTVDKQFILQSIFYELCEILDPGKPSFSLIRHNRRIIVFAGLQGSGKSTTCAQYAHYYKKRGWSVVIISADTFRPSNFDPLLQNAMESSIQLYGSFMASDPVSEIAAKGVEQFKNFNLIIIDTSERHTQESTLIQEMGQVCAATKPDAVVCVVRNDIREAALLQRLKQSVKVGGVIVTGFNYDANGGEALCSIAATKTPVLFLSRGEHLEEFEVFNIKHFVSHHLGDPLGLKEDVTVDKQPEVTVQGYPLRTSYKLIYQSAEIFPALAKVYPRDRMELRKRIRKCHLAILGSMKDAELDGCVKDILNCRSIMKIAKQSKTSVQQVLRLMETHKFWVQDLNIMAYAPPETCFNLREYLDKLALVVENPKRVRAVRNECQDKLKKMKIQTS